MLHTDGTRTIADNTPREVEVAPKPKFDLVSFVIDYESGELDEEAIIEGFQHLIDSGDVWSLQGHYGRTAEALLGNGYCTAGGTL